MGSLIDKIKGMITVSEDDDSDDLDYAEENGMHSNEYSGNISNELFSDDYNSDKRNGRVLNINSTTQLQVVLVKPERFEDATSVADNLNARRTVVLNLESADSEVSRRLVDFLSGVAYANNGQIKRVANNTFIITPYNVDIIGDILGEIENSGAYF